MKIPLLFFIKMYISTNVYSLFNLYMKIDTCYSNKTKGKWKIEGDILIGWGFFFRYTTRRLQQSGIVAMEIESLKHKNSLRESVA